MSSFDGLQIGRTALTSNQLSLDTIGKNIAHANDKSYARERVDIATLPDSGVESRVSQVVSMSLEADTLRENANWGLYSSQRDAMDRVESALNSLGDQSLAKSFDTFYAALENLSLHPADVPARTEALDKARQLLDTFHTMSGSLTAIADSVDQEVGDTADTVNSLLDRIAELNLEVTRREGSGFYAPATDMRNERRALLNQLSGIINVTANEQSDGSVIVQSSGRTLVFHGETRGMAVERAGGVNRVLWKGDRALVQPAAGRLAGLLEARDGFLAKQVKGLDDLAANFAWQVNRAHNQGRGLAGLTDVTAETRVDLNFVDRALDMAVVNTFSLGNRFKPKNGLLTIQVMNTATGLSEDVDVPVRLVGSDKMSLRDLKDALAQVDHLSAGIDNVGRLTLKAEAGYTFFIASDTSDVSAFLGLNNFLSGSNAANLQVSQALSAAPELLAAAKSDAPGDNANMAGLINTKNALVSGTTTLMQSYQNYMSTVSTQAGRISALADNQERILADVDARRSSYSGVSLDEEAANLLRYQRSYEASARFISVQDKLLETLLSLV